MLAYFCSECQMYYRPEELLDGKRCPECRGEARPRMVLGGQVMGEALEWQPETSDCKKRRR